MRRLIGFLVWSCLLAGFPGALAGDVSGEASTSYASKYVWRGIRFSRGSVQQTQGTVEYKGFSANIWTNYDYDDARFNEVDFTGTYTREFGKFSLAGGLVHYAIVDGLDSTEIFTTLGYSGWPVSPSVSAYFDVNAGKGAFLQAALAYEHEFSKVVTLNLGGSIGFVVQDSYTGLNDLGEEFTNFHSGELTAALPLKLNSIITLEPKIGYTFPLSENGKQAIRNSGYGLDSTTVYGMVTLKASF